jgi:hypothetical protein
MAITAAGDSHRRRTRGVPRCSEPSRDARWRARRKRFHPLTAPCAPVAAGGCRDEGRPDTFDRASGGSNKGRPLRDLEEWADPRRRSRGSVPRRSAQGPADLPTTFAGLDVHCSSLPQFFRLTRQASDKELRPRFQIESRPPRPPAEPGQARGQTRYLWRARRALPMVAIGTRPHGARGRAMVIQHPPARARATASMRGTTGSRQQPCRCAAFAGAEMHERGRRNASTCAWSPPQPRPRAICATRTTTMIVAANR